MILYDNQGIEKYYNPDALGIDTITMIARMKDADGEGYSAISHSGTTEVRKMYINHDSHRIFINCVQEEETNRRKKPVEPTKAVSAEFRQLKLDGPPAEPTTN